MGTVKSKFSFLTLHLPLTNMKLYKYSILHITLVTAGSQRCIKKSDPTGLDYSGYQKKTVGGQDCAKWIDAIERDNSNVDQTRIAGGVRHNFCRNPDNDSGGPWCFLKNYNKEEDDRNWGHCDIAHCENEDPTEVCYEDDGYDYRGTVSVTETGKNCRAWDARKPHRILTKERKYLASRGSHHNYCRNYFDVHPELRGDNPGERPWCYTTEKGTRWEYCDIPKCVSVGGGGVVDKEESTTELNPVPKCGIRRNVRRGRIVNGMQAAAHEFPWQIHLRYPKKYSKSYRRGTGYCGGQILNAHWILTAAHCVIEDGQFFDATSDVWVAVGWHKAYGTEDNIDVEDKEFGTAFIESKRIIPHEDYDSDNIYNDIALIELKDPIRFPDMRDEFAETYVRPICLPTQSTEDYITNLQENNPSKKCVISGWGDTEDDKDVDDRYLVYGEVPLLNNAQCDKLLGYGQLAPDGTNICAHHEGDHVDTCGGDSGGPLVCQHNVGDDERYSLLGLTSWGFKCGASYPGVYTRITDYLEWIENTTGADDLQYVDL